MSGTDAYTAAGYKPSRKNASNLKTKKDVIERVLELQGKLADRLVLTRQYVLDAMIENAEKALGRRPVKVTRREKVGEDEYEDVTCEVFLYRGEIANQALKLLGSELNLFTERKDVRIANEYSKLTDQELAQKLVEVGRQMLLEGSVIEHDGTGSDLGLSPSGAAHCRPRSR
jgi:phage terminase small subunit